jgi:hypothetical protein
MSQPLDDLRPKELFEEATRLLQRWSVSSLPNQKELTDAMTALAAADLDNLPSNDPTVVRLRTEVNNSWLHEHRLNLKAGSRRMTYVCVGLSLALMLVVGSLTVVYNRGVALLADVEALAATQPDRRFGQLERQLLVAQSELFAASKDTKPTECKAGEAGCTAVGLAGKVNALAQESSYLVLHELRDLNFQLLSLQNRTSQFSVDREAPIPAVNQAVARLGTLFAVTPIPARADSGGSQTASDGAKSMTEKPWTSLVCDSEKGRSGQLGGGSAAPAANPEPVQGTQFSGGKVQILGMDMERITAQACDFNLSYTSATVPSVRLWATKIRDEIAPYSLWLLPSLYASLGSIIFFMRLILDPAQPNPPTHRIVHRLALAALAGMMIGWFWEPTLGKDEQFRTAGFGLFTFSFIVGFSIDVFFEMLDRLVALSTSAISRIGK